MVWAWASCPVSPSFGHKYTLVVQVQPHSLAAAPAYDQNDLMEAFLQSTDGRYVSAAYSHESHNEGNGTASVMYDGSVWTTTPAVGAHFDGVSGAVRTFSIQRDGCHFTVTDMTFSAALGAHKAAENVADCVDFSIVKVRMRTHTAGVRLVGAWIDGQRLECAAD